MPTRRGWITAAGAAALLLAGRLLGLVELYVLATAALVLVAAATVYVHGRSHTVIATRTLRPERVQVHGTFAVELALTNVGRRGAPGLTASDPIGGRPSARFPVPPLRPGEVLHTSYRLLAEHRGAFHVGPLDLELSDPFGMATTATHTAPPALLTVHPPVERISSLPRSLGGEADQGAEHPSRRPGQDVATLRPYDEGDDLRKVHWPSTARLGELMIREEEPLWDGRATVLVDVRRSCHDEASMEAAVSAAASVVAASSRQRAPVRLVTTDGGDTGFGVGAGQLEKALDRLARIRWTNAGGLVPALAVLGRGTPGGTLVVVTTTASQGVDLRRVAGLRSRFLFVIAVLVERSGGSPSPTIQGVTTVVATPGTPFTAAWAGPVSARRRWPATSPAGSRPPAKAGPARRP